ncbi:PREDICTED: probable ATP-dependent DNA helicase HFM1 [Amphimedon queenslandica]|uniref:Helicase ATP-binding domain-containing protein n=1 Tax=Amphimedon queenslandica TaxID=400682 RepID=A0AAN0IMR9_AMPQE|nr:PREDICTED: probable ATP-dependent DNA helicase HFM1 [Amphimedon queenslandica]|eukprot:XP_011405054.1 PREDICTED: probable ATP-dependent DNA helicase HFM1 [Amphimedon queenslandica]
MASHFILNSPPADFLDFFSSDMQLTQPNMSHLDEDSFSSVLPSSGRNKDILGQSLPPGGEGFFDHLSSFGGGGSDAINDIGNIGLFSSPSVVPATPVHTNRQQFTILPQTEDQRLPFTYNDSATDTSHTIGLRPVSEIPQRYQSVFQSFSHFNFIQSKVFDDVMYTDTHLVTSAPTGSGKTVIFELAIVRILMTMAHSFNSLKIVYVAPIKALCSERYEDWSSKFGRFGLKCAELTGDSQLDDYFELQNAQIIMTTPEKWDSMTRKWRDNKSLVQLVQLFLLDEIHQLNDESRGPTVEAIVSRMKTVRSSVAGETGGRRLLRFIAISATLPNIDDIASWLGTEEQPAIMHSIDDSHRPVQLRRVVLGFPDASTEFKFDLSLNYKISGIIQCYSDQKPTLVFCATRKGTQQAAGILVKDARFVMNVEHRRRLQSAASSVNDSKLKELIVYGVGYHHAGMSSNDRKLIETMFTNGELPVLCEFI